ncbi:MAG: PEP-CTERM sorting domain-containing protein [Nitrosomonas sp.]|uniref:PEP-CTERM sorting domain-containing protein n=1 Tax=Nitrosomonas sp. TaxID=42353 RepID=UPI0025F36B1F|nr:PEP-CTERM sorting domain-containing protein [Nitrosomonas sp.]UJP01663.1 MAG: PEP-CTERM sorting domain-containing protein [Nitrosomonas sp.]
MTKNLSSAHFIAIAAVTLIGLAPLQSTHAASVLYQDLAPTGILSSPSSITRSFASGSGAGNISFEIQGYLSLDGSNCCTDTFSLYNDSDLLFQGTFNLGGGGTDIVFVNPNGAAYTAINLGYFNGGLLNVSIPVTFTTGNHVLTFDYSGSPQGLGDEGWGLNNITVEGVAAVPEPETYAMLLAGLGLLGFTASRRKIATA